MRFGKNCSTVRIVCALKYVGMMIKIQWIRYFPIFSDFNLIGNKWAKNSESVECNNYFLKCGINIGSVFDNHWLFDFIRFYMFKWSLSWPFSWKHFVWVFVEILNVLSSGDAWCFLLQKAFKFFWHTRGLGWI